ELLPRDVRPPRGRVPGLRGRRRALAGAAVLPGDDRRPGRAGRDGARAGSRARASLDSARVSRFSEPQDPAFQRLNASIGFDRRLWPYDIQQSRAHATMLAAAGIIPEDDRDALLAGLDAVAAELEAGRFPFAPDDEDIHMAIERRLTEIAGPVGGRLHTA